MDRLAFGLDRPKLALMQNGWMFVGGKPIITASAGTPAAGVMEKGSKRVRSMIAPQTLSGTGGSQEAVFGKVHVRRAIYITGHGVLGTANRHSAIRITPTNQSKWINDPVYGVFFTSHAPDISGGRYITLSGRPKFGIPIPGVPNWMLKEWNWATDVGAQMTNVISSELATDTQFEDALILQLINSFNYYQNNFLYTLIPSSPGEYNSNSFSHGLLNSVGLGNRVVNSNPDFPGWQNPLPLSAFGK